MKARHVMQSHSILMIAPLAVLLASLATVLGQGTVRVTFDRPPVMPPGSVTELDYYSEARVNVISLSGGFTRRWSGDPLYPDNGTAYLQPGRSRGLFFDYRGGSSRFQAVSVDLALFSTASLDPVTVQFIATGYSWSQVLATTEFTVGGAVDSEGRPAFETFYFPPEFSGMYYLHVTPTASAWSLDNLVVIPEPSAAALLMLSTLGLWLRRRPGKLVKGQVDKQAGDSRCDQHAVHFPEPCSLLNAPEQQLLHGGSI